MRANSILITSAIMAMIAAISLPQESGTSNVDITPKLAGNTSEPSQNMTETSPKRAGEIPPSFFYKDGKMKVRCNPPDWAYRIPPREVPDMHITFDDWTDWTLVKHEAAMVHIRSRQLGCYSCRCDENGGLYGVPLHERTKDQPWGLSRCFCTADLVSRVPEDRNLPISVLQEALDSIPDSVQGHNADFTWNYGSGTLRFSQPRRYLDPDTAEPYYLEGPDIGMNQAYYQEFRRRFGIPIKIYGDEAGPSGSGGSGGGGDGGSGGSGSGSGGSGGSGDPGGSGDGNPGGSFESSEI
ncbi:hypothetical protein TWF970_003593 [Orbilia oligospora]|nr:hypothetical protein TWF970_003593 [Orbilia oligospora]